MSEGNEVHYIHTKKKKNSAIAAIALIIVLAALIVFTNGRGSNMVEATTETIEGGTSVDPLSLVKLKEEYVNDYDLDYEGEEELNYTKLGNTTIEYVIKYKTNSRKNKTAKVRFEVVDTKAPVVKQLKKKLKKGSKADYRKLFSVKDAVDGEIPVENLDVKGKINTSKPGKYTLNVTASDSSGNSEITALTFNVTGASGSVSEFMKKITGLWLNGSQDASFAKKSAHEVGLTDVSMTSFVKGNDGNYYMSTYGDIKGQYDGDTVPDVTSGRLNITKVSADLKKASGTVNGMQISFDLGDSSDQVIFYRCGGYYTHCAYTGFPSMEDMNAYFDNKY